ncbi:MAG: ParB/RepB/Spo0J family partition protein [Paludibacteraceae bacterium]|jgi:ParB family chromosome partitioning protein|nr:ParB/RepB/Spo0J family partition protein [Paludibacteraceae bacterium]HOI26324.1 ParB/RepB/Spo0J family partition protein [Paludibacteraceae bacterium]HOU67341.1 ParB/RepB/Spo0J family partition protein [Paludibacteraceae bacterium]HPH62152.1 ParB/RepB/Spo0J family partition protein [Paludibacteraceae bacterium]HQF49835.1 ParB/RepB/Spo0J family partition protein [Paludibacteraceae bacterium]
MAKKFGLGKGLGALIDTDDEQEVVAGGSSSINEVPLSEIEPNPDQPRKNFGPEALLELSDSIRQLGVIQPITLRKVEDHKYIIIAGERRFRAAKMAELTTIPAYVREISNEQMMEMALVENIQREDLNAIEVALSYQNLMELCNYTQEQLSERVGKKRTTISNYLRLLRLPAEIQVALKDKKVDMGHARALIGIEDPISQLDIYNQIIKNSLSVRKVEELVRSLSEKKEIEKKEEESTSSLTPDDDEYSLLKEKLQSLFSSKVEIQKNNKGKGKISIPFKNDEELEKIMEIFDSLQK